VRVFSDLLDQKMLMFGVLNSLVGIGMLPLVLDVLVDVYSKWLSGSRGLFYDDGLELREAKWNAVLTLLAPSGHVAVSRSFESHMC
jgi:hypothetical protein